ncbi:hypothetical protein [Streptomyces sp. NPDC050534]|uniref:hypothetical protein n=1 Tax=Streptomyces sp. NPDC050534 TaxID=3365625 RepID=UPI003796D1F0
MTPYHAVEVILTRPVTRGELRRACRGVPLAANADRTRLMALHHASSPGGALHTLRRRLDPRLPIDALTTQYPDQRGQVLLNVMLNRAASRALHQAAASVRQRPEEVLRERVSAALAQDKQTRIRQLQDQLENLLAHHTAEEILACVAGSLHRSQYAGTPAAP